jgi:NRAMP (natural resistance-associated macrophage protein)-like metal ion transporter
VHNEANHEETTSTTSIIIGPEYNRSETKQPHSMAYMDPGNYGTDIQAGASLNYGLLWVVWLSSGMAMLLQYLSGKIGIATGLSLPELIRQKLKENIYYPLLVSC